MKKILVTGANSYIGKAFIRYVSQWPDEFSTDAVHMKDGAWQEMSFAGYDVVLHAAGIAHRKETRKNAREYYDINRDLADGAARKAKREGVGQFIFLSSMSVYGLDAGVITKATVPAPNTHYGTSKLQAEERLARLNCGDFRVAVLRPPMVYGKGCQGNFQSLVRFVERFPVFPAVRNERSMIYVDSLCAFIRLVVDGALCGLYFPQNRDPISTSQLAVWIAAGKNRKIRLSPCAGFIIAVFRPFVKALRKAFGSLTYRGTEDFDYAYCVASEEQSVLDSVTGAL